MRENQMKQRNFMHISGNKLRMIHVEKPVCYLSCSHVKQFLNSLFTFSLTLSMQWYHFPFAIWMFVNVCEKDYGQMYNDASNLHGFFFQSRFDIHLAKKKKLKKEHHQIFRAASNAHVRINRNGLNDFVCRKNNKKYYFIFEWDIG